MCQVELDCHVTAIPHFVGHRVELPREGDVGAGVGVQQGLACEARIEVHNRCQRFVVHDHPLGGVHCRGPGLGDHQCDGLADETYCVVGHERPPQVSIHRRQPRWERPAIHLRSEVHGDHPFSFLGLCHVNGGEACMGFGRAHVDGLRGSRQLGRVEPIDIGALAAQQRLVFAPPVKS